MDYRLLSTMESGKGVSKGRDDNTSVDVLDPTDETFLVQDDVLQEELELVEEPAEDALQGCHWGELLSAVAAGLIFIGLHYVPANTLFYFLVPLCVLVGGYVVYKMWKFGFQPVAKDWGLGKHNFGISFLWCSGVGVLAVVIMIVSMVVLHQKGLPYNHHLLLCLLLYPLWGVVQQFLVQDLIALNLSKIPALSKRLWLVYLLTACAFTIVHFGDKLLMAATFLLGLLLTPIFLKYKCLYPLGLYHGWLGALFYWYVLQDDPLN